MGIFDRLFRGGDRRSGLINQNSGAGIVDKTTDSMFDRSVELSELNADRYYHQSWFIKAMVDVPVDDMLVRWREFTGDDAEAFGEAEEEYGVRHALASALKSARLHGTGLLVMVMRDAPPEEPLDPEMVNPGDLIRLHVTDRHHARIAGVDGDFASPTYGMPIYYDLRLGTGGDLLVHSSRVLRFDGVPPTDRVRYLTGKWGSSIIEPALDAARIDASLALAIGHLSQEASIPVLKLQGYNDLVARAGINNSDDATPAVRERVAQFNRLKSNYRTSVIDSEDELARIDVRWNQLPGVVEVVYKRLAAIAQMPATRLMGQSPDGMNATGAGDARNWATTVAALQESMLTDPLKVLDEVVARSAGLQEAPPYEWLDLIDMSIGDKATAATTLATAVSTVVNAGILDEDEARGILDESGLFGDLDGEAPERPEQLEPPDRA